MLRHKTYTNNMKLHKTLYSLVFSNKSQKMHQIMVYSAKLFNFSKTEDGITPRYTIPYGVLIYIYSKRISI